MQESFSRNGSIITCPVCGKRGKLETKIAKSGRGIKSYNYVGHDDRPKTVHHYAGRLAPDLTMWGLNVV